jgi:hypothetical protein
MNQPVSCLGSKKRLFGIKRNCLAAESPETFKKKLKKLISLWLTLPNTREPKKRIAPSKPPKTFEIIDFGSSMKSVQR